MSTETVARSGTSVRRMTANVGVRFTPAEKAELVEYAAAHGVSAGAMLRASYEYVRAVSATAEAVRHAG